MLVWWGLPGSGILTCPDGQNAPGVHHLAVIALYVQRAIPARQTRQERPGGS